MTVLSIEKIFPQPRAVLWPLVSKFKQAPRWVEGVEKVEHIFGQTANVGGVWRVHLRWNGSFRIVDLEIIEWLAEERFSLRPVGIPTQDRDVEFLQLDCDLKIMPDRRTRVAVQCEYKPLNRLAKIKNLAFTRRNYLQRLNASLEALERIAIGQ
jgi:hypothetical protein